MHLARALGDVGLIKKVPTLQGPTAQSARYPAGTFGAIWGVSQSRAMQFARLPQRLSWKNLDSSIAYSP